MKQRIITGLLLGSVAITLMCIGGWVLGLAMALIVCLGIYEAYHVLSAAGHRPVSWPTWAGVAAALPAVLIWGVKTVIPLLMLICLLMLVCVLFRREPKLEDVAMSMLPLFTVLLPGMCMMSLLAIEPYQLRLTLLFMMIAIPCLGDIAAYFVGSKVGGPKLCPPVSPNKTISGSIAGLAGSIIGAVVVQSVAWLACGDAVRVLLPTWWECLLLGLLGGAAGQVGDLCFSLIKRHCGVKDYSNIFPGHGGMLDRMDSVLFMCLVLFCYRMMTVL